LPTRDGAGAVDVVAVVEVDLLAGTTQARLGEGEVGAARAEFAPGAAESDRLILSFAMTNAHEVLAALPADLTVDGAPPADVVIFLRGKPTAGTYRQGATPPSHLSPAELRVLSYLPTHLTRSDIAHELYVSVNPVNTHVRDRRPAVSLRRGEGWLRAERNHVTDRRSPLRV
jgi:LuxR family transcriptional regulator, maltose regulon positive regulatory protein